MYNCITSYCLLEFQFDYVDLHGETVCSFFFFSFSFHYLKLAHHFGGSKVLCH